MVQYDGTDFFGSQAQPNKRTVQGVLSDTLKELLAQEIKLVFASRTDRGVHATHNVCSLKVAGLAIPISRLPDVLNDRLPFDLRVVSAREVPGGFHPRYMADRRTYEYRLFLSKRDDIRYLRISERIADQLDLSSMHLFASVLPGERDFTHFAVSVKEIKDPICHLYCVKLVRCRRLLIVKMCANRFLRRMACKIVGSMVGVGKGELTLSQIQAVLSGVKPEKPLPDMPSKGLSLTDVHYPEDLLLFRNA